MKQKGQFRMHFCRGQTHVTARGWESLRHSATGLKAFWLLIAWQAPPLQCMLQWKSSQASFPAHATVSCAVTLQCFIDKAPLILC